MFKSRELTDQKLLTKLDKGDRIIAKAADEVAYLDGYTDAQYGYAHNPQGFSAASGLARYVDEYRAAYTEGYQRRRAKG